MTSSHMTLIATVFCASAGLAAASAVQAADEPTWEQRIQERFVKLDSNHDGFIDTDEAKSYPGLRDNFGRVAPSGRMTAQEFMAWEKKYDAPSASE